MLGHGPGQFHAAATPHLPAAFARAEGPDRVFSDAHNVVVEFGVSTGVPGAVLLVTFAIMLMRRARGPLALFGMTVAITWLLEPMSPNTAPLALLSIGAADVRVATLRAPVGPRTTRALIGLFATAGFFAATAIVIGDVKVYQARVNDSPEQLSAAERWVPRSAFISAMRANHYVRAALINQDESAGQEAIRAAERTVRLRSEHHGNWVRLGDIESFFGSDEDAVPYYREALERYPWSESAWRGLAVAATRLDDGALLREANEHLCLLASPLCDQISVDPP